METNTTDRRNRSMVARKGGFRMLIQSPSGVRLGEVEIGDVKLVVIERRARRVVEEWSDDGPSCVLVDVPEERVTVRIERRLAGGGGLQEPSFVPGHEALLRVLVSRNQATNSQTTIEAVCVVVGARYQLDSRPARQILELVAVSTGGGGADPVVVEGR